MLLSGLFFMRRPELVPPEKRGRGLSGFLIGRMAVDLHVACFDVIHKIDFTPSSLKEGDALPTPATVHGNNTPVEDHFKRPVILTDYPKEIKAFYMKQNEDGKTVRAMDVLFPKIGEIIGGSEREADYDKLMTRIDELGIPMKDMWWYLDTRRFGTVPHSGFGLGFERLLLFVTGMANIRDVIPFPRTPNNAEF